MNYIEEKSKKLPIYGEYDVVVAGGGVAGISAAIAASRTGAKTILIEKQFALGGLATMGLVTYYLPLCDGCGRQVSFGIAEELLKLSIKYGYETRYPKPWLEGGTEQEKKQIRYEVRYNAQIFAILAEQQLKADGVEILYGTSVCGTEVEDGRVTALIIENKSGRQAVTAKSIVDCTGDADIFHMSGAKTAEFDEKNVLTAWYYSLDDGKYNLNQLGWSDVVTKNSKGSQELLKGRRFAALEAKELSEMTELSHEMLLLNFLEKGNVSDKHILTAIATIPQIRMTRRPVGAFELDLSHDHCYFEDSIGMIASFQKAGPIFEVPFRCLYGYDLKNVVSAGRCISNTDSMWELSRVIPCCAVTGQAAGTAAAITDDFISLDVQKLQNLLEKDGVQLHIG